MKGREAERPDSWQVRVSARMATNEDSQVRIQPSPSGTEAPVAAGADRPLDLGERYRSLFENMLEGYAYCRMLFDEGRPVDWIYLAVNPAFTTLTGLENAVGRKVSEVIPGLYESNPDVFEIYGEVATTGVPRRFETFVEPLGIWFEISAFRPEPGCFVAVFDNVTDEKLAVAALFESERFAVGALDSLKAAIAVVDDRGQILNVNRAWREFASENGAGDSRAFLGANYLEICDQSQGTSSEGAAVFATGLRAVLRGESPDFEIEYPCHSPSEQRWFVARVAPFAGGGPSRAIVAHIDVTLRRVQEDRLSESQKRLESALDAGRIGTFTWDAESDRTQWDRGLATIFGRDASGVAGRGLIELRAGVHPEDRAMTDGLPGSATSREGNYQLEYRVVRPNGSIAWVLEHGQSEHDGAGRLLRVIGACVDLTDRRALEDQLRQSQKLEAIGELAGGVAHDFNNLLTVIAGNCELLDDAVPANSPARNLLAEIRDASDRAARLTRQLLAFSRSQSLAPRILDLGQAVSGISTLLRRLIGEDIALDCRVAPGSGWIRIDPVQLEQILINLSVNAADAMPKGGRLTIEASAVRVDAGDLREQAGMTPGRYVSLSIRDTGTGMSSEVRTHIFEPFFTTKGVGKGTGLGLATVFGIVKQSGGQIEVESELDRGTRFEILLPSVEAPPAAAETTVAAATPKGHETVLLVEDEAPLRKLARLALERQGYRVLAAGNAVEAVELVAGEGVVLDLLVSDMVMPGMNGIELAEALREQRPNLRVLFISGYVDDALLRRGLVADESRFLQKPFKLVDLVARVRAILDDSA
jgi:two-component system, cell cycle sensor histidine kinase and response regulator CckA